VVVLAALAVPLFGGRLGALVEIRLRHVWAIFAALALEIAAMELPGLPEGLRAALTVAAYPVGVVFLVANWHLPGMPLVALGAALNLLAISVKGGVMPASPSALAGLALGGRARVPELDRPGRAAAGVPGRRLLPSCLLAAQQRLQCRGRADRPRDCLGAAPHLPVTPGPFVDPPTLVSVGRQAGLPRPIGTSLTVQATSSGAPGLRTGPRRVRLVVLGPRLTASSVGCLPPVYWPPGSPGDRWCSCGADAPESSAMGQPARSVACLDRA
jgi:hypothetical protein